jgi:hypothetical protein
VDVDVTVLSVKSAILVVRIKKECSMTGRADEGWQQYTST